MPVEKYHRKTKNFQRPLIPLQENMDRCETVTDSLIPFLHYPYRIAFRQTDLTSSSSID